MTLPDIPLKIITTPHSTEPSTTTLVHITSTGEKKGTVTVLVEDLEVSKIDIAADALSIVGSVARKSPSSRSTLMLTGFQQHPALKS